MPGTTIIVGASHAGVQTAASLRDYGYDGRILLVSDEPHLPYHRPPLSKTLVSEAGPAAQPLRPARFYEQNSIEFMPETRIASVAPEEGRLHTQAGRAFAFDALVLATGARPTVPKLLGCELEGVLTLRNIDDAVRLGRELQAAGNVVVIGAGMIGLEFAAVASKAGKSVTIVEAAPRALGRAVSAEMSDHLTEAHGSRGVQIVLKDTVVAIHGHGRVEEIETRSGLRLPADLVVMAVGVVPNAELATAAGFGSVAGVEVDSCMRTKAPNIVAVGDCALHPNRHAGATIRIESVQNATDQGRSAAATLMGRGNAYAAVPWFWSDQYELKLQIAGITLGHDLAIPRRDPVKGRLSVICFRKGRLVGVESLNNARDHMAARRLLAAAVNITPDQAANPDFDLGAVSKQMAAAE